MVTCEVILLTGGTKVMLYNTKGLWPDRDLIVVYVLVKESEPPLTENLTMSCSEGTAAGKVVSPATDPGLVLLRCVCLLTETLSNPSISVSF